MSNDFENAESDTRRCLLNGGKEMVEQRTCSININELRKNWKWKCRATLPSYNNHPFLLGKVKIQLVHDLDNKKWNIKITEPGPRCRTPMIFLTSTRCNYGGTREWFICPSCSRRVGILYREKDNFRCRKCLNLVYYSQKINYRSLQPAIMYMHEAEDMVEKYHLKVNKLYNGKPTKKTIRYEKLRAKHFAGFDYYGSKYLGKK